MKITAEQSMPGQQRHSWWRPRIQDRVARRRRCTPWVVTNCLSCVRAAASTSRATSTISISCGCVSKASRRITVRTEVGSSRARLSVPGRHASTGPEQSESHQHHTAIRRRQQRGGYLGNEAIARAMEEMKAFGMFEKGVFTRQGDHASPASGAIRTAMKRIWEYVNKRKLDYPQPRS